MKDGDGRRPDPALCSQFSLAFFLGEVEKGLEISILMVLISLLRHQHLIEFLIHLSKDRVSKVVLNGHVSSVVAIGSRSCTGGLHLDARVTRTAMSESAFDDQFGFSQIIEILRSRYVEGHGVESCQSRSEPHFSASFITVVHIREIEQAQRHDEQ